MRRTVALALLVGLGLSPVLASPAPEAMPAAAEVERLIEKMADRNPQTREAAYQALRDLGPESLPALRRARDHADPEVRRRVVLLIETKELAARLAPKRVTLHVHAKPIRDVIAEIAKQTSYKIEYLNNDAERDKQGYDYDLENVPFWDVLQRISTDSGLVMLSYYRSDGQITLQARDSHEPFVYRDGIFRVSATGFNYNRQIQFGTIPKDGGDGQRSERMSLSLQVSIEPRLRMLAVGTPQLTEAVDDKQNSMLLPLEKAPPVFLRHDGYKTLTQNTQLGLAYPDREAQKVKRLRGSIPVTILMEERPDITVDKILDVKKQAFKSETTELIVEDVTEEKEGARRTYKLKMKLRDLQKDTEPGVNYALDQRIELQDAKGNKYRSWGYSLNGGQKEITGTFTFSDFGGGIDVPVKLVYYNWVTVQHHVGFEFKDLPLP